MRAATRSTCACLIVLGAILMIPFWIYLLLAALTVSQGSVPVGFAAFD